MLDKGGKGFCKRIVVAKAWFYEACFPPKCLLCRRGERYLCSVHHIFPPAPRCEIDFKFVDEVWVSVAYHDLIVKKTVEYFKFNGFKDVGRIIASDICSKLPDDFWDEVILIPIPLHWTRQLWRGFNQSAVLAKECVRNSEVLISNNLRRKRRTDQQSRLSKKERHVNMQDAFVWKGDLDFLKGKTVVLIDDVVATGSTLDEAAKVLKACGAKEVKAVVWAQGGK